MYYMTAFRQQNGLQTKFPLFFAHDRLKIPKIAIVILILSIFKFKIFLKLSA